MKETDGGVDRDHRNFSLTVSKYFLHARYVSCSKLQMLYINYLI